MTIWFVVQVDHDERCLGVRGIHLDPDSADLDLWEANKEFEKEQAGSGWPKWRIRLREVEDL